MPVIRINAEGDMPRLHASPRDWHEAVQRNPVEGPAIVFIHGYKYSPGHSRDCPHRDILSLRPAAESRHSPAWLRQMGFGTGHADEGLAIAFGWDGRGALWTAQRRAIQAGLALARVVQALRDAAPARPVHVIAHSMGIEPALEALHHLPAGAIDRIVSMTGASYHARACEALDTAAGRRAEFVNVTSRENDPFDFLFERLIRPPVPGDRAIGHGLDARNAVTLQLDCPGTLTHLARLGAPIGPPIKRICHWSAYTRPGVLRFYNDLLRRPERWPLSQLKNGLPGEPAPRWSRLFALPALPLPLPATQKTS